MTPQGQFEKGSYVRNTEGKQKLNIYTGKLVGIQLLKTNLEKIIRSRYSVNGSNMEKAVAKPYLRVIKFSKLSITKKKRPVLF